MDPRDDRHVGDGGERDRAIREREEAIRDEEEEARGLSSEAAEVRIWGRGSKDLPALFFLRRLALRGPV